MHARPRLFSASLLTSRLAAGALGLLVALLASAQPLAARPLRSVDGLWRGTLDTGGSPLTLLLTLRERADGRLLGFVLGGTGQRTVVSGQRSGADVTIDVELRTPAGTRLVTVSGALRGHDIRGSATDGVTIQKIVFEPVAGVVHERRFLFALPGAGGDPTVIAELAVALGDTGALVAGGWVGQSACDVWGCDGEVTSFSEAGGTLAIGFRSGDVCSAGSSVEVTMDASTRIYAGTYTLNTCGGATTAAVLGARSTRTRSDHVAQVLGGLGRLGDDLEGGAALSPPHPSFSSGYLERGTTLAGLLARYSAEIATYSGIEATFNRVSFVSTVPEPETPFEAVPLGAIFAERRTGIPPGGGSPVAYVDTQTRPQRPWLRVWADEGAGWVIRGSQTPALHFPFAHTLGTNGLEVPFGDGSGPGAVHVSLGSWGAHFSPLTGHAYGDAKANLVGFFTASDADLTTLSATQKGYYGGPAGSLLLARRPLYVAPEAGVIHGVECFASTPGLYLGGEPQWVIRLQLPTGEDLQLGHMGRLAPSLAATLAALGISTATCPSPGGGNLLPGGATVAVAAGEGLGRPQVVASPVTGYPDYFVGGGTFPDRPWAQMEFFFAVQAGVESGAACYYDYLGSDVQASLQSAMTTDMLAPDSQRYRTVPSQPWKPWQWKAEGRLCMAPWIFPVDFSGLYTNLGGWFEKDGGGIASDELVAFAPIATDVATYDPAAYSAGVEMLILRRRASPGFFTWLLPGATTPVAVFYPAAEILERSANALLVKWRDLTPADPPVYQRAAYILDASGLKIHWGGFAATPAAALLPALSAATPCNGSTVVCYDHTYHAGY